MAGGRSPRRRTGAGAGAAARDSTRGRTMPTARPRRRIPLTAGPERKPSPVQALVAYVVTGGGSRNVGAAAGSRAGPRSHAEPELLLAGRSQPTRDATTTARTSRHAHVAVPCIDNRRYDYVRVGTETAAREITALRGWPWGALPQRAVALTAIGVGCRGSTYSGDVDVADRRGCPRPHQV